MREHQRVSLSALDAVFVAGAGVAAGAMNAVVGAGSVLTFPTLVAVGIPPLSANVSNTLGVAPGNLVAAWAYRDRIRPYGATAVRLCACAVVGALIGAVLLLAFPASVFEVVVPVLLVLAALLTALQPRVVTWLALRPVRRRRPDTGSVLLGAVLVTSVYGGYFGAAQGVILLSVIGVLLRANLQDANALKNLQATFANGAAAALFAATAPVNWAAAALVGVGSTVGAVFGSRFAQRIPDRGLRIFVIVFALAAVVWFVLR